MSFDIHNRRYTGSKYKLLSWINENITNYNHKSFVDIFAGTGIVSASLVEKFDEITVNDFLFSNFIMYQAFFGKGRYSKNKINAYVEQYNNLSLKKNENYFSKAYGGKFFSTHDAYIIGIIRQDIEDNKKNLSSKEYFIMLASLMYSSDKIANTVGHYDAYRKKIKLMDKFKFRLIEPINHNVKFNIYQKDANSLIKSINADVLYVDPPYNSRQYSRFYHVLENLATWSKPELFGTARKPEPSVSTTSSYCKTEAFSKLKDLIESANSKLIILSYNNTYNSKSASSRNKISLDQIELIMRLKGKTKIIEKQFSNFNAGKTDFSDHKEFLFITET